MLRQNRMVQALAWVDQGLAWHPDQPELLMGRIAVLLAQERYRSALAAAERLLAVTQPDQVAERLAVAAAFNANGRFRDTLAVLEPLPPAAQDNWQFHAKRGEALAILERSAEARVAFATADRLDARAFRTSYHDGPFQLPASGFLAAAGDSRTDPGQFRIPPARTWRLAGLRQPGRRYPATDRGVSGPWRSLAIIALPSAVPAPVAGIAVSHRLP